MKIDDSNKRYSIFIAGILVISILSIFLAIALGVWDYRGKDQIGSLPFYHAPSDNLENNGPVSVSEKCEQTHDTGPGSIKIHRKEIPSVLPICIKNEDVAKWWILYESKGGYVPDLKTWIKVDGQIIKDLTPNYGWIELEQRKTGREGILLITAMTRIVDLSKPCALFYNLSGFVVYGARPIVLDSNELPTEGCQVIEWSQDYCGSFDKEVDLDIITNWEGCHLEKQEFRIILIQKVHISRIPNSP
ncbi:MAG: hypothetical protein ACFFAU_20245 [Candidatus Hodarchaeota archaeon]